MFVEARPHATAEQFCIGCQESTSRISAHSRRTATPAGTVSRVSSQQIPIPDRTRESRASEHRSKPSPEWPWPAVVHAKHISPSVAISGNLESSVPRRPSAVANSTLPSGAMHTDEPCIGPWAPGFLRRSLYRDTHIRANEQVAQMAAASPGRLAPKFCGLP
jgi:hypothetical protein